MGVTTETLRTGLAQIAGHMEAVADELNTLDGKLGDGDLGITMQRGGRAIVEILPELPDDVGMALMKDIERAVKKYSEPSKPKVPAA